MINIVCSSRYQIDRHQIKEKTAIFLTTAGYTNQQTLNLIFVGKNKMRQIANKYKKEDEALPVLSFTYKEKSKEDDLIREIFLCYPQIVLLAVERDKKVDRMIMAMIEHGIKNLIS